MSSPDPFAPIDLFAFPLFSTVLGGWEQHKQGLVDLIQAQKAQHPGVRRSNRGAWHAGDEFLAVRDDHLAFVLQNATTYARRALAPYYHDWTRSELRLGTYWANVLGKGGWNAPHHHHPQHWSGCYYVHAGKMGTGAEDPSGMIEFLNPSPMASHWGSGSFAYAPRDGVMLLFPSCLVHLVHPYDGDDHDGERISIAFNFNVFPKR